MRAFTAIRFRVAGRPRPRFAIRVSERAVGLATLFGARSRISGPMTSAPPGSQYSGAGSSSVHSSRFEARSFASAAALTASLKISTATSPVLSATNCSGMATTRGIRAVYKNLRKLLPNPYDKEGLG